MPVRLPAKQDARVASLNLLVLSVFFVLGGLHGCTKAERLVALEDREQSIDARLSVAQGLDLRAAGAWGRVSLWAWMNAEPSRLRIGLLELLREHDTPRFWAEAASRFMAESDGQVVALVLDWAQRDGEMASSALLRRWASLVMAGHDAGDESNAFAVLFDLGAGETPLVRAELQRWINDAERSPRDRLATWQVLSSQTEHENETRDWLRGLRPLTTLTADLQAVEPVVDLLPRRQSELLALSRVRAEFGEAEWEQLRDRAMSVSLAGIGSGVGAQRRGLAVRHLPLLGPGVAMDRLRSWMKRGAAACSQADALPALMDLAVLGCIAETLDAQATRKALFALADADHADKHSEHGGLVQLLAEGGGGKAQPGFVAYEPSRREHDRAYHAPPALVLDAHRAVASFHFHAERYANKEHARPGSGDLRSVEATQQAMAVLTFTDRDTLSVTVALPGGRVFDLGVIKRPWPPS